ncbi:MAG: SPOR domain-containing protein [Hyphomicrobiales bacterium]
MKVANIISVLLHKYGRIIIPGLGGFILRNSNDTKNNTPSNTKRDVLFSAFLTIDDGFLSNHLAEIEKISYAEAKRKVDLFVAFCKEEINAGNRVYFDKLGWMYNDKNGKLQFEEIDDLDQFQKDLERKKNLANNNTGNTQQRPAPTSTKPLTSVTRPPLGAQSKTETPTRTPSNKQTTTRPPSSNYKTPASTTRPSSTTSSTNKTNPASSRTANTTQNKTQYSNTRTTTSNYNKTNTTNKANSTSQANGNNLPPNINNTKEKYFEIEEPKKKKMTPTVITILAVMILISMSALFFLKPQYFKSIIGNSEEDLVVEEAFMGFKSTSKDVPMEKAANDLNDKDKVSETNKLSKNDIAKEKTNTVTPSADQKKANTNKSVSSSKKAATKANQSTTVKRGYYIIAASFAEKSRANKCIQELKVKGYNALICPQKNIGRYRVSYGVWTNKNVAEQELQVIRSSENKDAWMIKLN